jgi:hypothetical protein
VVQSIAWVYAPGAEPHTELDPLDVGAEGESDINVWGVIAVTTRIGSVVLRS